MKPITIWWGVLVCGAICLALMSGPAQAQGGDGGPGAIDALATQAVIEAQATAQAIGAARAAGEAQARAAAAQAEAARAASVAQAAAAQATQQAAQATQQAAVIQAQQVAAQATSAAAVWQATLSAQATRSAVEALATTAAVYATATSQAQDALSTVQAVQAAQAAQATRDVMGAQAMAQEASATAQAMTLAYQQSQDQAQLGRLLLYLAAMLAIVSLGWIVLAWARRVVRGIESLPPVAPGAAYTTPAAAVGVGGVVVDVPSSPLPVLPSPDRRMPGVKVCADDRINGRVEALFDQLERESHGTN